jgi:ferredoxin
MLRNLPGATEGSRVTLVALIDPNACIAHGDCEEIAPEIFVVEDVCVVIGSGSDEQMLAAAAACPTDAIRIVERETREQRYP